MQPELLHKRENVFTLYFRKRSQDVFRQLKFHSFKPEPQKSFYCRSRTRLQPLVQHVDILKNQNIGDFFISHVQQFKF
jgi:hypothetical protein